jgi:hypothetical protein
MGQIAMTDDTGMRNGLLSKALMATSAFGLLVSLASVWMRDVQPDGNVFESASLSVYREDTILGRIPSHAPHRHKFRVKNNSMHAVEIDAVKASCSCSAVSPKSFILQPEAVQVVEIEFSPGKYGNAGPEEVSLQLAFLSDSKIVLEAELVCTVFMPVVPEQKALTFRNAVAFGRTSVSQPFRIHATKEVESLDLSLKPEFGEITEVEKRAKPSGNSWEFRVRVPPSSRLGQFTCPIIVRAILHNGPMYEEELLCSGIVDGDIKYWPESIGIAANETDAIREAEIEVWSESGAEVADLAIAAGDKDVRATLVKQDQPINGRKKILITYLGNAPSTFGSVVVTGHSLFHGTNFKFVVPYSVHLAKTPQ